MPLFPETRFHAQKRFGNLVRVNARLAGKPGRLNGENRQKLKHCGAQIRDERSLKAPTERDAVTNYHVRQILRLREEILEILENKDKIS